MLDQQLTSGGDGGGGSGEPTGPGLHGTGLDATSYGDTTLQPGRRNRLTYEPDQPFIVKFTNQGENDEFDIKVTLRIARASGGYADHAVQDRPEASRRSEKATVELPLDQQPPLGHRGDDPRRPSPRCRARRRPTTTRSTYPALFDAGLGARRLSAS